MAERSESDTELAFERAIRQGSSACEKHGGLCVGYGHEDDRELTCVPEWCEPRAGQAHESTCPESFVAGLTKGSFVAGAESTARAAIGSFLMMREEGFSIEEATDQAVDEANESATCFAGIGSCGRGWCKHS